MNRTHDGRKLQMLDRTRADWDCRTEYHDGFVLQNRYEIQGRRSGRWNAQYSRTYMGWDRVRARKVEIQEYCTDDGICSEDLGYSDRSYNSYARSQELFQKMGNSPSRWCGMEGVERICDFFKENGTQYIVREYVDGMSLQRYLQERCLSAAATNSLMNQLMNTLSRLHANGIIHKGIDPRTIFIARDGRVLLQDFGNLDFELATLHNASYYDEALPDESYSRYTPEYRYNQIEKTFSANRRWIDIYSLCAVYYTCVTGEKSDWYGVNWDGVPGISCKRRSALKKGMCAGNRTWYQNVDEFRREFLA